jgi:hypothetical protein
MDAGDSAAALARVDSLDGNAQCMRGETGEGKLGAEPGITYVGGGS